MGRRRPRTRPKLCISGYKSRGPGSGWDDVLSAPDSFILRFERCAYILRGWHNAGFEAIASEGTDYAGGPNVACKIGLPQVISHLQIRSHDAGGFIRHPEYVVILIQLGWTLETVDSLWDKNLTSCGTLIILSRAIVRIWTSTPLKASSRTRSFHG